VGQLHSLLEGIDIGVVIAIPSACTNGPAEIDSDGTLPLLVGVQMAQ
jgi:hypothetical protein